MAVKKDEPRELEVEISSGTIVRTILICGLFVTLWFLRDIILVVLTAVILASAIEPAVRFFVRKNVPRLLALVLIYASGGGFLGSIFYFFVPAILDDVGRLAHVLPKYIDISTLWSPLSAGSVASGGGANAQSVAEGLLGGQNILDIFKNSIQGGGTIHLFSVFFGGFLSFVLIFVLSFYLAAQERGIENFLRLM
jgi:predicted PurR-regulated permease PerM